MTSGQSLSCVYNTTTYCQDRLRYAITAAASCSLKSLFRDQLQEYDLIESEIQYVAARRGLELPEFRQAIRWLSGHRFRSALRFQSSDAEIAEVMICRSTKDLILTQQILNGLDVHDKQVLTILQKLLDCQSANIRQLLSFL